MNAGSESEKNSVWGVESTQPTLLRTPEIHLPCDHKRRAPQMTVDERLESLLKSTESLHATVQQMTGQIDRVSGQIQEHTKQLELDAANIRSLANIAAAR